MELIFLDVELFIQAYFFRYPEEKKTNFLENDLVCVNNSAISTR